jgi:hypothetical protein
LERTATIMPMYPARMDASAPTTKESAVWKQVLKSHEDVASVPAECDTRSKIANANTATKTKQI